ncbi:MULTISPECIES: NADH-quinone oxidoreductase subunit NuoE family protein [Psychrilyobacter]|uniref:NAD(P)H-dependent oxidoreductase subunit E n=1 Tax=Psychrilyobacter piezotolerans TaxID=2293438 RepID=A0ABX9KDJ0_9FUSO|nr:MULTISPECIES: NAD(P)H-dependent oxidoreductase subunit E [Psychrilyobacter]MCS5422802.1 NAD(P)H-dependent oxidoreductase subunit E [Psychrilyobacter sp. S5]NDI79230.1 NAD(P)H-dependent oxidoreductase subunit E [Psychrilyobacter piezotolerans]RDE58845.1 NAD(P)H-dependent oxidoreductase subunit E [Psychrilyobacter sp. S5]REI39347.1 NAD(P)H-dependent oxidoreductase subunit E [Psychrilyobacter piezotolerans]
MSCKNTLKQECFNQLDEFIIGLPEKEGALISVLHKAQEIFGYIPMEIQEFVADRLELPLAKIYGVVSFYSFFTMTPKGKFPISVCMGTACFVRGADKVLKDLENKLGIKAGETTLDGLYSIDALRCVGACGLAPVVLVGEDVFGKDEARDIEGLLAKYN